MQNASTVAALKGAVVVLGAIAATLSAHAAQIEAPPTPGTVAPAVAAASEEGTLAIKRFVVSPGLKVDLWASEPHLANPVAIAPDEKGRWYVAETFRLHAGVTDIRGHMDWLDEELASQTVSERVAIMKRHLSTKEFHDHATQSDRVRLLEDTDGDGKADRSTVFAEGFKSIEDGLGAGVLAWKGNVYYTCIPNLWLLRDENGDGKAEIRKSLQTGYGVRAGFLGHDLHGLRIGPDGRLYFSVGDRGFNVKGFDGQSAVGTEYGAVFRCNLDGTGLEVFHVGLRNPQELAFDDYGDLFTGDNNSDGGDQARWVYVVEGGDSGWRVGFQFIEQPNSRGPWNAEKMWHPQWDGQAAFLVPPIANLANGPSGVTYYPGTGLPERFNGHFFLADFRGGAGSGVWSFALKPKGATFELVDRSQFLWEILATDVEFGVDGGVYVADWVAGWNMTGKGRIYRVSDPVLRESRLVRETQKILGEDMSARSTVELAGLLGHPDQRVRQAAQFALVDKGSPGASVLIHSLSRGQDLLTQLHGVWGLGQLARTKSAGATKALEALRDGLVNPQAEVRAQSAKVLGDARDARAESRLTALLNDPEPRPRFFAAIALGHIGSVKVLGPVTEMLRANADRDRYLRHAGVMAFTGIAGRNKGKQALQAASKDPSAAVRMGALLALRRLQEPSIAEFLTDKEPLLIAEAARAINDLPIPGALPQLAALSERAIGASADAGASKPSAQALPAEVQQGLLRRVIAANYRVGTPAAAAALARIAASTAANLICRTEAVECLAQWSKASGRDRVTSLWRPVPRRDAEVAAGALRPVLPELLLRAQPQIRIAAAAAVSTLHLTNASELVFQLATNREAPPTARAEALKTLANQNHPDLQAALQLAQADANEELRNQATRLQAKVKPTDALISLRRVLEKGSVPEKQASLATLASMPLPEADGILGQWLDDLLAGRVPGELQLDVLEAASRRGVPLIKEKAQRYELVNRKPEDSLRNYRECLSGGNAAEGKKIFFERAEVACVRCHKIRGEGGEVGPELTGYGKKKPREYILESIVAPNANIAAGFENVLVTMKDGMAYAGVLKEETATELIINSPEEGLLKLTKANIKTRERGPSAMPEELKQVLSKRDLRDLVEFIFTNP